MPEPDLDELFPDSDLSAPAEPEPAPEPPAPTQVRLRAVEGVAAKPLPPRQLLDPASYRVSLHQQFHQACFTHASLEAAREAIDYSRYSEERAERLRAAAADLSEAALAFYRALGRAINAVGLPGAEQE